MKIIDGKEVALLLRKDIFAEIELLKDEGKVPGLAVVLVGEDPASEIYVRNKENGCQEVGCYSEKYVLPEDSTQESILKLIDRLNKDNKIDGILVQLPLPKHIDESKVIDAIAVDKDVDGFSPHNIGNLLIGKKAFEPCTPKGCMELIRRSGVDPSGKKAVIIGRSNIVGKPIALLLLAANATVCVCHSKTQNIEKELSDADIIVVAIGKAGYLQPHMVKDGAVIIDVGINRLASGKVVGDADFTAFEKVNKACSITPVPGGVGPMTITMLLANTLESAKLRKE